jgi:AcrR family transcriptional regulator
MMPRVSTPKAREVALTDALLGIVADRGLDQVSVREVASAAEVSIGTVQHYFPTKDAMLAAAFNAVVQRIRSRLEAVELGPDGRRNLSAVLRELLPLDDRRRAEAAIEVAFAARAATAPALADIQRAVLAEIHGAIAAAFATAWGAEASAERCRRAAHVAVATADGLALHAVSSNGALSPDELAAALELMLDALLPAAG